MDIKGKKALVVGLGRSGAAAASLLSRLGAQVTITDRRRAGELNGFARKLEPSVRLALGGHPMGVFEEADLIVISPGVPLDIEPLRAARDKGADIIGELELAYRLAGGLPFYAVTGTNGKSTTTTLLNVMLRKGGLRTIFGGNIGNAITGELKDLKTADCVVVEVSSFQLESIAEFRPKVAAVLNITPDHLDRYHSMDEYRLAKARVALNQKADDFLVLNHDGPETMRLAGAQGPRVYGFSRTREVEGVYYGDGVVYSNIGNSTVLIRADEIRIKGIHNLENAMAASAMALLAGCPAGAVRAALVEFPGLEHRLEPVREIAGVWFINDSKGTNVGAVLKSLEGFDDGRVILIAGGRDKAGDFAALGPLVNKKVKAAVLIGEASAKMKAEWDRLTNCVSAGSMKEAVTVARGLAEAGDSVLLSPACASFDMFADFEDRGRKFKEAVAGL